MKKALLATTALAALGVATVAAPASAAGFEMKVGGYMEQWFGYTDNANSAQANSDVFEQHSDVEIHFKAKQTLDNGLTIGAVVELEGENANAGTDEQYMTIEGSFGKIIMGSEDTAPYLMHYGSKTNGIGVELVDMGSWGPGTNTNLAYTGLSFGVHNDNNSITYISPRVSGLQVGASYVPEQGDVDSINPGVGGTEANGNRDNGFGVAANYTTSVAEMSLKLSLGYADAGDDKAAAVTGDDTALQAGIQLGFGGFTASLAYGERQDDDTAAMGDVNTFSTSLAYNSGPAGVSILYVRGENASADDKQDIVEVGANYAVGPGVTAKGSVFVYDRTLAGANQAEGAAVAAGLVLSF
jgi:outer membrane protein OmpU